jgi:hypothetical protein
MYSPRNKHENAGDRDYLFKYLRIKRQGNRSTIYSCTSTGTFFVLFIMGSAVSTKKVPSTPICYSRYNSLPWVMIQKSYSQSVAQIHNKKLFYMTVN